MKKNGFNEAEINTETQIVPVAEELAKYSVKDFAVRYGWLEGGNAKA
jgi:hypothetical protein